MEISPKLKKEISPKELSLHTGKDPAEIYWIPPEVFFPKILIGNLPVVIFPEILIGNLPVVFFPEILIGYIPVVFKFSSSVNE